MKRAAEEFIGHNSEAKVRCLRESVSHAIQRTLKSTSDLSHAEFLKLREAVAQGFDDCFLLHMSGRFQSLDSPLIHKILKHVPLSSWCNFAQTCRHLRNVVHELAGHYFLMHFGKQKNLKNASFLPQFLGVCKDNNIDRVSNLPEFGEITNQKLIKNCWFNEMACPTNLNMKYGAYLASPSMNQSYTNSCLPGTNNVFDRLFHQQWLSVSMNGFSDMIITHLVPQLISERESDRHKYKNTGIINTSVLCCLLHILSPHNQEHVYQSLLPHLINISHDIHELLDFHENDEVGWDDVVFQPEITPIFFHEIVSCIIGFISRFHLVTQKIESAFLRLLIGIPKIEDALVYFFAQTQYTQFSQLNISNAMEWFLMWVVEHPSVKLQLKDFKISNNKMLHLLANSPFLMRLPYDRNNPETTVLHMCNNGPVHPQQDKRFKPHVDGLILDPLILLKSDFFVMPTGVNDLGKINSMLDIIVRSNSSDALYWFCMNLPLGILSKLPFGMWITQMITLRDLPEITLMNMTEAITSCLPLGEWYDCNLLIYAVVTSEWRIKFTVKKDFLLKFCDVTTDQHIKNENIRDILKTILEKHTLPAVSRVPLKNLLSSLLNIKPQKTKPQPRIGKTIFEMAQDLSNNKILLIYTFCVFVNISLSTILG